MVKVEAGAVSLAVEPAGPRPRRETTTVAEEGSSATGRPPASSPAETFRRASHLEVLVRRIKNLCSAVSLNGTAGRAPNGLLRAAVEAKAGVVLWTAVENEAD